MLSSFPVRGLKISWDLLDGLQVEYKKHSFKHFDFLPTLHGGISVSQTLGFRLSPTFFCLFFF